MTLLLSAGIGLACLPHLLLGVVCVAVALLILYLILLWLIPAAKEYITHIMVILLLILVLYLLVQIYSYGLNWVC